MKRNLADFDFQSGPAVTFPREPEPEVIVIQQEPVQRFRFDRETGDIVPIQESGENFFASHSKRADFPTPAVRGDIPEYRTVASDIAADGKRVNIGGRRQHREFLKRNGYVEIGNDFDKKQVLEGQPRRPDSISAHRVAKRRRVEVIKRSIDDHRSGRIKRGEVGPAGER